MNSILADKLLAISRLDLKDTIIAVDFDGTCVFHDFPKVGASVPYAREVLLALTDAGAKLIVWTIRSDQAKIKNDPHSLQNGTAGQDLETGFLRAAINWFTVRGIQLYGHNINPQQCEWSSSPKCYAHIYIDDAALGCPLIYDRLQSDRPFVDWDAVAGLLLERLATGS
jgi:hypothetical protein